MVHALRAWLLVLVLLAVCLAASSCGSPTGNLPVDSPLAQFQPSERDALAGDEAAWGTVASPSPTAAGQEPGSNPGTLAPAPSSDSAAKRAPEPSTATQPTLAIPAKTAPEPARALPEPAKAAPKPTRAAPWAAPFVPASPGAAAKKTWGTAP